MSEVGIGKGMLSRGRTVSVVELGRECSVEVAR